MKYIPLKYLKYRSESPSFIELSGLVEERQTYKRREIMFIEGKRPVFGSPDFTNWRIYKSILNEGMVNPLIVKRDGESLHLYVVVGNQRLCAIRVISMVHPDRMDELFPGDLIPCIVSDPDDSWFEDNWAYLEANYEKVNY